ncbi:hypothetical protein AB4156_43220, partial [Cupriavidus sp. 2MCAB6]|uniref:hypothetical protein n=1 Tax=Cupriavidus sp. 2MCAB6 TaxID=3232981 RepID=UPI003F92CD4F
MATIAISAISRSIDPPAVSQPDTGRISGGALTCRHGLTVEAFIRSIAVRSADETYRDHFAHCPVAGSCH